MIGLMYRKGIPRGVGMLFTFSNEGNYGIWMQNMVFGIDVLWLDKNKRVVDIANNLKPCRSAFNCTTYYPRKPSKYIIELNEGEAKRMKIKINSKAQFK
jgi:uncharacterized protein